MAQLDITILGQQYKIGCPNGKQDSLLKTVVQVDEHLTELRQSGRTLRNEQLIVMTILNYRHQLNVLEADNKSKNEELNRRIEKLESIISRALGESFPKDEEEIAKQNEKSSSS